jgi:hypothetical protein
VTRLLLEQSVGAQTVADAELSAPTVAGAELGAPTVRVGLSG